MAQEKEKRRIVIASILKPVNDTRMFEKMGISLAQSGLFEVFIIGFQASVPSFPSVWGISLPLFPRLSWQRWLTRWRVFIQVWKIRPDVLIFNTHELIVPAIVLKVTLGIKIIYDVRENYYRNILYSGSLPGWLRWPAALSVRTIEKLAAPAIDHFFLAEKGYEKEFKFHRSDWTVLENKVKPLEGVPVPNKPSDKMMLLFSGTLAESTGVFQAIDLAKELHKRDSSVEMVIVGYAALKATREKIEQQAANCPFIQLIGIDTLVPHETVIQSILSSHAGIISYPPLHHTENSHPTKLFEYLNYRLPIIVDNHWPWTQHFNDVQPFALFDFSNPDYSSLLEILKTKSFYLAEAKDVTWLSEEKKLLETISQIIKKR